MVQYLQLKGRGYKRLNNVCSVKQSNKMNLIMSAGRYKFIHQSSLYLFIFYHTLQSTHIDNKDIIVNINSNPGIPIPKPSDNMLFSS